MYGNSGIGDDFIKLNCATLVPVLPVPGLFATPIIKPWKQRRFAP
jgi:hypothetical protein